MTTLEFVLSVLLRASLGQKVVVWKRMKPSVESTVGWSRGLVTRLATSVRLVEQKAVTAPLRMLPH